VISLCSSASVPSSSASPPGETTAGSGKGLPRRRADPSAVAAAAGSARQDRTTADAVADGPRSARTDRQRTRRRSGRTGSRSIPRCPRRRDRRYANPADQGRSAGAGPGSRRGGPATDGSWCNRDRRHHPAATGNGSAARCRTTHRPAEAGPSTGSSHKSADQRAYPAGKA
jgi:hypothetical protein